MNAHTQEYSTFYITFIHIDCCECGKSKRTTTNNTEKDTLEKIENMWKFIDIVKGSTLFAGALNTIEYFGLCQPYTVFTE